MGLSSAIFYKTAAVVFIAALFFVVLSGILLEKEHRFARLGSATLQLEFALTPMERYTGLSKRSSLCAQCGLLFLFPDKDKRSFVMRQMNFPLDIVWLDTDTVIGFSKNLIPEQEPYTPHNSPRAVNAVLEVPAGFIDREGIKVGDKLRYE